MHCFLLKRYNSEIYPWRTIGGAPSLQGIKNLAERIHGAELRWRTTDEAQFLEEQYGRYRILKREEQ